MTKLHALQAVGQSTWLNYLHRDFIESGALRARIDQGIQGVTANAAVFEACIRDSPGYDHAIYNEVTAGTPFRLIHRRLMVDDVQRAADQLRPLFAATDGLNGYASLELDPGLAHDATNTIGTARSVLSGIDRDNTMVEVPGTLPGCEAIRTLTADGVSLNATYLFAIGDFERAAQAYICGLETYVESHSIWRKMPTAVASFSVGAVDEAVGPLLAQHGRSELAGQVGIALARLLYGRYKAVFSGPRWARLARLGAHPMRPKWTRIRPADAALPLTYYADALIAPDTIVTFSPETLDAFLDHGVVGQASAFDEAALGEASATVAAVAEAGIDLDALAREMQARYLTAAVGQYERLVAYVVQKLPQVDKA